MADNVAIACDSKNELAKRAVIATFIRHVATSDTGRKVKAKDLGATLADI